MNFEMIQTLRVELVRHKLGVLGISHDVLTLDGVGITRFTSLADGYVYTTFVSILGSEEIP
jgi:hypothetical protein